MLASKTDKLINAFINAHKMLLTRGYKLVPFDQEIDGRSIYEHNKFTYDFYYHIKECITELKQNRNKSIESHRQFNSGIKEWVNTSIVSMTDKTIHEGNQIWENEDSNILIHYTLYKIKNDYIILLLNQLITDVCQYTNKKSILIIVAPSEKKISSNVKKTLLKFDRLHSATNTSNQIEIGNKRITVNTIGDKHVYPIIEFFSIATLQADPTEHVLTPKHTLIKDESFKLALRNQISRYTVKPYDEENYIEKTLYELLPLMTYDDPIAKWFGANIGDIFLIERSQPYKSIYIRIVVPDYMKKTEKVDD